MKIILKGSIRTECPTIDNQTAYLDSVEAVGGYCKGFMFNPQWDGCFVIAERNDLPVTGRLYFFMLPAKAWRKDLELDNYTVLQTLTRGHLLLDDKALEQDSSGEGL